MTTFTVAGAGDDVGAATGAVWINAARIKDNIDYPLDSSFPRRRE
ncbi:hypothetical protein [uncultured Sphingomonas sp.]